MVFYIFEQGQRMTTPVRSNFPPKGVREINAATGQVISSDSQHQNEAFSDVMDRLDPNTRREAKATPQNIASRAYTELSQTEEQRHPELLVKDIMAPVSVVLEADADWQEVKSALRNHPGEVLVVNSEQDTPWGLLDSRSLGQWLQLYGGQDLYTQMPNAQKLSNHRFYSSLPTATVRDIASLFVKESLQAVPVIDQDNRLLGMVTESVLLQALLNMSHADSWV